MLEGAKCLGQRHGREPAEQPPLKFWTSYSPPEPQPFTERRRAFPTCGVAIRMEGVARHLMCPVSHPPRPVVWPALAAPTGCTEGASQPGQLQAPPACLVPPCTVPAGSQS